MIRTYNKQTVVVENGVTKYLADIFCNSTDTKPTANLVNGSKLTEVDTGKTYLFDEEGEAWTEVSAGGGGGGGGEGVEYLPASATDNNLDTWVLQEPIEADEFNNDPAKFVIILQDVQIGILFLRLNELTANTGEPHYIGHLLTYNNGQPVLLNWVTINWASEDGYITGFGTLTF